MHATKQLFSFYWETNIATFRTAQVLKKLAYSVDRYEVANTYKRHTEMSEKRKSFGSGTLPRWETLDQIWWNTKYRKRVTTMNNIEQSHSPVAEC